jgi:hypothetical protein
MNKTTLSLIALTLILQITAAAQNHLSERTKNQVGVSHPQMLVNALPSMLTHPQNPYVNWNPGPEYADSERMFQGIPSIAAAPGGQRLWATWYGGGTGEGPHNYILLASSGDGGATWSKVLAIIDPPYRASEPAVWVDPDGMLWWMWNQYPHGLCCPGSQLWVMTTRNPDDENPVWDSPRLIATEMNNFNKPIVLRDGTWLWPTGSWQWNPGRFKGAMQPLGHRSRPLYSQDGGKTFSYRGAIPTPPELNAFDEYQVVERKDGVLWLMNRMRKHGIAQSFSRDGGKSWSEFEWSGIHHTTSRFFFGRLRSGNLLLVKNGQLNEVVPRSQMMAFLSKDDGATWEGGLMLDERGKVSYPDADQTADGTIHVIYDRARHHDKEILLATFTEADVLAAEPVSAQARLKVIINKATGINSRARKNDYDLRAAPLIKGAAPNMGAGDKAVLPISAGAKLFADRDYEWNQIPEILEGRRFIQMGIGGGRIVIEAPGVLYVASPQPTRNRDSQQRNLMKQGFSMVSDVAEFSLFKHSLHDATLCRLYQKEVAAGDKIEIGQWGVITF